MPWCWGSVKDISVFSSVEGSARPDGESECSLKREHYNLDPLLCFRLGTVLLSCLPRTQPAVTSPRCGLGVLCRDGVRGVLITPPHSLQRSPAQCSDTKEETNAQRAEIPKHVTSNHREANGTEPCGWSMCIPLCIINLLMLSISAGNFQGFQN